MHWPIDFYSKIKQNIKIIQTRFSVIGYSDASADVFQTYNIIKILRKHGNYGDPPLRLRWGILTRNRLCFKADRWEVAKINIKIKLKKSIKSPCDSQDKNTEDERIYFEKDF